MYEGGSVDMQQHPHDHGAHAEVNDAHEMTYHEKRAGAILSLLVEKDVVSTDEIWRVIDDMDSRSPALGARVVAKAWVDPEFKARLLNDAKAALDEMGIDIGALNTVVALENTRAVHNVVVCTLCSCYPRSILGVPPDWYKSLSYRSRVVVDPRGVLKEFGFDVGQDTEVRVYDSTADIRYLVIPARPSGTEHMTEEELAGLVTRDSMIGVSGARTTDKG
jgi:nitrile hydratase